MLAAESADEHDDDQLLASNSGNETHEEAGGDSQIAAAVMVKLEQEVDGVVRPPARSLALSTSLILCPVALFQFRTRLFHIQPRF